MTTAALKTTTAPTLCVVMTANAVTRMVPGICAVDDRVTKRASNVLSVTPRKRGAFLLRTVMPRPVRTMAIVNGIKSVITATALYRTATVTGAAVVIATDREAVIVKVASTTMTVLGIKSATKATA